MTLGEVHEVRREDNVLVQVTKVEEETARYRSRCWCVRADAHDFGGGGEDRASLAADGASVPVTLSPGELIRFFNGWSTVRH